MLSISDFIKKYSSKINRIDLELIIANSLGKTREFVLTYPECIVTSNQQSVINKLIKKRMAGEPVAYLVGHKEFYGLDFVVNRDTLIPRPETEQIIELTLSEISNFKSLPRRHASQISNLNIVDIGTGSGNIIISIVTELEKNTKYKILNTKYYGIDISKDALKIAGSNAKKHKVDKKIRFFIGDLLSPFIENCNLKIVNSTLVVVANLPYLSKEIYSSAPADVKKYEPKSALYSSNAGLAHYKKLLKQVKRILKGYRPETISCFLEISPEQKHPLTKLIKNIFPSAKITFFKDLAGKWRVCKIILK